MQYVSQIMSFYWGVQKDLQKVGMKASVKLYGENDDSVLKKKNVIISCQCISFQLLDVVQEVIKNFHISRSYLLNHKY